MRAPLKQILDFSKRHKVTTGVGVVFLAVFVVWPTVDALVVRGRISRALKQAGSVRLEEFSFHVPLTSVELPRSQW